MGHQRRGYGKPLPLAARKFAHPGVGFFREPELGQDFFGGPRLAIEAGEELDGLANRELLRQAGLLQGDAEHFAQLARLTLPGAAEDANFARGGLEQALEDFDSSGLAGAVRSEQHEAFAFANLEFDPAQRFHLAVVGLAEVTAFDRQRRNPLDSSELAEPGHALGRRSD